jgi:hypothetical protein
VMNCHANVEWRGAAGGVAFGHTAERQRCNAAFYE